MNLIIGQDEMVADWMSKTSGKQNFLAYLRDGTPMQTVFGWEKDGEIKAAAIFTNCQPNGSIEAHICGKMTKTALRDGFQYAFKTAHATRITAIIRRANRKMTKMMHKRGFVMEGVLKNYYGPRKRDNGIIYRIEASQVEKWLR